MKYIQSLLESEKGELTSMDHEVLESLQRHETISSNVNAEFEKDLTLSEKKADLEIRHLNDKIDHLLSHQWERLVEIQQIQIDLLSELERLRDKGKDI